MRGELLLRADKTNDSFVMPSLIDRPSAMGRQREFGAVSSSHSTGPGRCWPSADTGYVCSTLDTGRSGPLLAWRLNDCNVPKTVSWATPRRPTGSAALPSLEAADRMTAMGHIAVTGFASVSGS